METDKIYRGYTWRVGIRLAEEMSAEGIGVCLYDQVSRRCYSGVLEETTDDGELVWLWSGAYTQEMVPGVYDLEVSQGTELLLQQSSFVRVVRTGEADGR